MQSLEEFLFSFFLSLFLLELFARWQRKARMGQHVRREGPQLHNYKEGTPTMGGVVFVGVSMVICLILDKSASTTVLVLSTFLFFSVGFIDGILKLSRKSSDGLTTVQKLTLQTIVAIIIYLLSQKLNPHSATNIPFIGKWEMGWFYPVFAVIFLVGMSNASNLTDGLDGLAGGIYVIGAIGLAIFSVLKGLPTSLTLSTLGGTLAFLFLNVKPAKIFMGDVGSLALGGFIGTVGVMYGYEFWILILFPIFTVEVVTDLIQIIAIRKFNKKVFKMAPIHHHYELKGMDELKVTVSFWLVDLVIVAGGVGLLCAFH